MRNKKLSHKEIKELEELVARDMKQEQKDAEYLAYVELRRKEKRHG